MKKKVTQKEYQAFQEAYDFFNRELFDGHLPEVFITLQRRANSRGYFSPDRFAGRNGTQESVSELALNPDHFGRTDAEICSTLVHEMCHFYQHIYGTAPTRGYHDKEWGEIMKSVGLYPSSTGEPGGKETGGRVTHYIIAGGRFERAFERLAKTGFALHWKSEAEASQSKRRSVASKTKYQCPNCSANAWAKPGSSLACTICSHAPQMKPTDGSHAGVDMRVGGTAHSKHVEELKKLVADLTRDVRKWQDLYYAAERRAASASSPSSRRDPNARRQKAFETLHITADMPKEIIKLVYRELSKMHHPDKGGDVEKMKVINAAYDEINKK